MEMLILGANSDIAHETAKLFAKEEKASLTLASRDAEALAVKARDLEVRYGVIARPVFFDADDLAAQPAFFANLPAKPDVVLLAFGRGGDQKAVGRGDLEEVRLTLTTNLVAAASILEIVAAGMESRGAGTIIGLSSVAGLRGRKANYTYGASKAGLSAYLSGLRNRLAKKGVRVITVLPGFVKTKMTAEMDLPGRLAAEPEEVAADIHRAFRKNCEVVYSTAKWRWIMLVIRLIPEKIFKRLSI